MTGYVFNDEIIRYVGVPDMHTHFWGLIVKEDWKSVVDKLKGIDLGSRRLPTYVCAREPHAAQER